jgi:hypothetical protein
MLASNPGAGWFAHYPELVGISVGKKEKDGQVSDTWCLVFEVEEKVDHPARLLPSFISANGISIPTDVIPVGKARPAFYGLSPAQPLGGNVVGSSSPKAVARLQDEIVGTLGVRVFRDEGGQRRHFVLGCYHVLCAPELRRGERSARPSPGAAPIVCPGAFTDRDRTPIGSVTEGMLNGDDGLDVALAEIDHKHSIFQPPSVHRKIRHLRKKHRDGTYRIQSWGRLSWNRTSVIKDFFVPHRISYPHGDVWVQGLIEVDRLADAGDSGAVAVNLDDELIGIIVATNKRFSYLIPIDRVLTELRVELWPPNETVP